MLAVQNSGVVCCPGEGFHVFELPVYTYVSIVPHTSSKVPCLVHKTSWGVSAEEVGEGEAVVYNGDAPCSEGQGAAGVAIVAWVGLAVGEEAECYILAGKLLARFFEVWMRKNKLVRVGLGVDMVCKDQRS
jgi:hypothetical protein